MSSSAPTKAKTTELPSQLTSLGLNNIADNLDDFLARATQKQLSPRQVLEQLARLEVDDKVQRSFERRFKHSKIGRFKPIADFDWNWPKKIDRGAIEAAWTLDFLREGRNFIVLGSNGLGKTMSLKNIAHQAVLDGHSVLVRTASDMLDELDSDSPELRRQRLRKYFRPKLLCIDELGYLSYDENAADLLFHVVNPRYDARRSIVLTTNLAFKDWNTVFPNATGIATLLDRLTHHADVTVLEGKSYRVRESEQENDERKQRRRQKKTSLKDATLFLTLRSFRSRALLRAASHASSPSARGPIRRPSTLPASPPSGKNSFSNPKEISHGSQPSAILRRLRPHRSGNP